MTSLRFLQQLLPSTRLQDISTTPADQRLALVTAINAGIDDWTTAVPPAARTFPGYASFPAPTVALDVTCTENSTTISGAGFTAADIGKSVILEGDPVPNVLTTATTLRIPYGGTTGSRAITLFGEACPLPAAFEGLAGPVWHEASDERKQLPPLADLRRNRWFNGASGPVRGTPLGYGIENGNTLAGTGPGAIMRLYPIPNVLERLSFDWYGRPQSWTMTDLIQSRALDLSDPVWNEILSLALPKLLSVPGLLAEGINASWLIQNAEKTLEKLRRQRGTPHNRPLTIGTPDNW